MSHNIKDPIEGRKHRNLSRKNMKGEEYTKSIRGAE